MQIELQKYNFPDKDLFSGKPEQPIAKIWIPEFSSVVLGTSNKLENALVFDEIENDNIPVYKRPSGGETVLLSPNTIVISAVFPKKKLEGVKKYFIVNNEKIIKALQSLGVESLGQRGISDVTIENKKIVGSSIYQNKDIVFYHAVLNVQEKVEKIAKYIKHPTKEPDYRKGRKHTDFVTSVKIHKPDINIKKVKDALEREFFENISI